MKQKERSSVTFPGVLRKIAAAVACGGVENENINRRNFTQKKTGTKKERKLRSFFV